MKYHIRKGKTDIITWLSIKGTDYSGLLSKGFYIEVEKESSRIYFIFDLSINFKSGNIKKTSNSELDIEEVSDSIDDLSFIVLSNEKILQEIIKVINSSSIDKPEYFISIKHKLNKETFNCQVAPEKSDSNTLKLVIKK